MPACVWNKATSEREFSSRSHCPWCPHINCLLPERQRCQLARALSVTPPPISRRASQAQILSVFFQLCINKFKSAPSSLQLTPLQGGRSCTPTPLPKTPAL